MNTGNKNSIVVVKEPSLTQSAMSSLLIIDSEKNQFYFPPLNDSNNFGALDNDAHLNTKIGYSINYIFKPMTFQELNTKHHMCELERTYLLNKLAKYSKVFNPLVTS